MEPQRTQRSQGKAQDPVSERVIACAIAVHRALGPGLLESAYQQCMAHEMFLAGVSFAAEGPIPVEYRGIHLDCGYKADFLVEDALIVELKRVYRLLPIHDAQVLTYMRLARVHVGLILNFNVRLLKDGIRRLVL